MRWRGSGFRPERGDDILTRVRDELARRRAAFMDVFKGFAMKCEPGAPFAWLELPESWTGKRLAATLRARRIAITPGTSL